jgi:hypothetical protein
MVLAGKVEVAADSENTDRAPLFGRLRVNGSWQFSVSVKHLWLLKNSCFAKIGGIWEIENVHQNEDRRL